MRVALILSGNLFMAPYVRYYTEILEQSGVSYDIFAWDRLGIEEAGVHAFKYKSDTTKSSLGKVIDYICYYNFVKTKLTSDNYQKVVVFTIFNTLLLYSLLKKRYKKNYVFDVRDSSVTLKFLRARMSAAVQNAAIVVISSPGFKQWLPRGVSYFIRHNTSEFKPCDMRAAIKGQTKWSILTIGSLRDPQANKKLIQELSDCSIFTMRFVGSGPAESLLKQYVACQGIQNVSFHGRYEKQDELKYLKGVSFINILTHDDINSMTLMSNRFYLSVVYGIPMIVSSGTEQARWAEKYNLGVIIGRKSSIKEQLIQYLHAFDREEYNAGRKACLQVVQQDIEEFETKFRAFLQ